MPGVTPHAQEAEVRRLPVLSLGYTERPCLKKNKQMSKSVGRVSKFPLH